jgi:hypothetical protein
LTKSEIKKKNEIDDVSQALCELFLSFTKFHHPRIYTQQQRVVFMHKTSDVSFVIEVIYILSEFE